MNFSRRKFVRSVAAGALALPFYELLHARRAFALDGTARRFIVFYFPDGVPGRSANGEGSLWSPTGSETSFALQDVMSPLERHRDDCIFFNGLSMGPADEGSHPGGAKKLLTAVDGGGGESIDQFLARTVGASSPHRHLYLGAMANHNGASGDKHISYPAAGTTTPPEDDPLRAFQRLFAGGIPGSTPETDPRLQRQLSVLDTSLADLNDLRSQLGSVEQTRLDLHLEALREVEARIQAQTEPGGGSSTTCTDPTLNTDGFNQSELYEPGRFPAMLRMQIDLMVQAMACNLSRVGVIQGSHHTSELIMSRFAGSEMYDPGFDMRSHQASHYGTAHDFARREFADYYDQRKWWVGQFAYLLESLRSRPEGDGTMLDHSVVLLCSEVSDGNTHLHSEMPFILAGKGGGALRNGRLLQFSGTRHSNLLVAIARAMGSDINNFGQESSGPLAGVLT